LVRQKTKVKIDDESAVPAKMVVFVKVFFCDTALYCLWLQLASFEESDPNFTVTTVSKPVVTASGHDVADLSCFGWISHFRSPTPMETAPAFEMMVGQFVVASDISSTTLLFVRERKSKS